jgi:transposase
LACADGVDNKTVTAQLGCAAATVGKWRGRFVAHRLDGLTDEPRPGRPAVISAGQVEDVVVATLEPAPDNATHWSRAKMAERTGLSKSTIGRIWKAFDLKPHRAEGLKVSNDPLFVEKVYDIVGLYLNPPEAAVVLCVDEKSQVQALARFQPAFPMMPGMPEKRTHDYVRHDTTSLFAAFNIDDGTVISALHRRHRATEFKKFLAKIDTEVPGHFRVHLVCDNYGTHKHPHGREVAGRPPEIPHALHPDLLVVDQPGRATVCLRHHRPAPAQRPPQRPSPRDRPPQPGQSLERRPQTTRLDQNRRTDPQLTRTTSSTNYRRRTLDARVGALDVRPKLQSGQLPPGLGARAMPTCRGISAHVGGDAGPAVDRQITLSFVLDYPTPGG